MQNLKKMNHGLRNHIRNLVNFHPTCRKSENLHFDGYLLSLAYKGLDENLHKNHVSRPSLKSNAKFKEKLILGSKNDIINLVNFNARSDKSENVHFDVLRLPKVYYVRAKKVQRSYVS